MYFVVLCVVLRRHFRLCAGCHSFSCHFFVFGEVAWWKLPCVFGVFGIIRGICCSVFLSITRQVRLVSAIPIAPIICKPHSATPWLCVATCMWLVGYPVATLNVSSIIITRQYGKITALLCQVCVCVFSVVSLCSRCCRASGSFRKNCLESISLHKFARMLILILLIFSVSCTVLRILFRTAQIFVCVFSVASLCSWCCRNPGPFRENCLESISQPKFGRMLVSSVFGVSCGVFRISSRIVQFCVFMFSVTSLFFWCCRNCGHF